MKLFEAIVDDGQDVFKVFETAKDEKDFKDIYGGNGEIVRLKDVSENYEINVEELYNALVREGYNKIQALIITRCVEENYICATEYI